MSEQEFTLPTPTDEHRLLLEQVGKWNVQCTYYMDPSQPPMEATAVETIEAVGQFWTVSKFESEFTGTPFVGRATLGYDTHAKQWVGTWIDCMSTVMFSYRGAYSADTKVLDMRGEGFMALYGGVCPFRSTIEWLADGEHRFEMFVTPPGADEHKMFTYRYTRADG